jgi:hypothetical protein
MDWWADERIPETALRLEPRDRGNRGTGEQGMIEQHKRQWRQNVDHLADRLHRGQAEVLGKECGKVDRGKI